jgi:glycine cleavage system aminomethyltransferase T
MQPVYSSKHDEYDHIRHGVTLADESRCQKVMFHGPEALSAINGIVMSDVARLPIGRLMSSFILNTDGSLFGDVYVWNEGDSYFVFGETRRWQPILDMVRNDAGVPGLACAEDVTDRASLLALDGPFAWELLKEQLGVKILGLRYLEAMPQQTLLGTTVDVLRVGKTGEFGYVLKCDAEHSRELWQRLLEAGALLGLTPCGSQALELCRLENRFPNIAREGARAANPLELNCRVLVSRDKGDYLGREAVEAVMATGPARRIIGIRAPLGAERGLAEGAEVRYAERPIGTVVAADRSPTLGTDIALALLDSEYAYVGCSYDAITAVGVQRVLTVSAPFIFNRSLSIRPQEDSFYTVSWSAKPVPKAAVV